MAITGALRRFAPSKKGDLSRHDSPSSAEVEKGKDNGPVHIFTFRTFVMGALVSLGGLIFGYDTGQISGFVQMTDFRNRFGNEGPANDRSFSDAREGTIVGLLSIGTLIGALIVGPLADFTGRKYSITFWNLIFIVGVIVQITTTSYWYQVAVGRLVAGFGVGALSVLTPMYQAESAPKQIRGALVSTYQLFITLGIFIAYCINYGTYNITGEASWRITMGIGFVFPALMGSGILLLRESPRWEYRHGKIDSARTTIAKAYGVSENHVVVDREIQDIREKLEAEQAGGKTAWYGVFTGPRMFYRTCLGLTLQALQQLTGANFFFYYGTSVFKSVGIENSFVTSMILGGVNFGCTFLGLYVVETFGRRKSLMTGAVGMFVCFMIFASVGHECLTLGKGNQTSAGDAMIVFACIFILFYATTWGCIVWALVSEIYPSRYRATAMGIATASNWTFNFLISFFTPFITSAIDYRYGYVFAGCNFAAIFVVFFFVCESQGRSLEEIDTMYVTHVPPWKSSKWQLPEGQGLGDFDRAYSVSAEGRKRGSTSSSRGAGAETNEKI